MKSTPLSVTQYIRNLDYPQRVVILRITTAIRSLAPGVTEEIDHSMPYYRLHGKPYMAVGWKKNWVSLYCIGLSDILSDNRDLRKALKQYRYRRNYMRIIVSKPEDVSYSAINGIITLAYERMATSFTQTTS